jgi:hypothetical protein
MDKRKIRGVQLRDAHSVHYFQMSDGELSMTVDCVHGSLVITEKELLSYLQSRNSLKSVERNDSGGVVGEQGTANSAIVPCLVCSRCVNLCKTSGAIVTCESFVSAVRHQ